MNARIVEFISSKSQTGCLFIISETVRKLEAEAQELSDSRPNSLLPIGRELSQVLIVERKNRYAIRTEEWFKERIQEFNVDPVLCKDIDILLQPEVGIDPLVLFKQSSRHKKLMVFWPGSFQNNTLFYATPNHKHYRSWSNPQINFFIFDGS